MTLRQKIRDEIVYAFRDGKKYADQDVDYPADFKTNEIMQLIDKYTAEKLQEYENDLLETLDDISNKPWRAIRHIRELYEKNVQENPDWYEEVARDYMLLESFYSNGGASKIEELLADPTFNVNYPDLQAELSKLKEEE